MYQLGNLYTGRFSGIPKLSVNNLYYAYDLKELYCFNSDGSPKKIAGNLEISDINLLEENLNSIYTSISGLTQEDINIYDLIDTFSGDTQNKLLTKQNLPTGFISGLELSVHPTDNTKAIIGTGAYTVTDFSNLEDIQVYIIRVEAPIEFTPEYLNTFPVTYVALDIDMNIVQRSSPFNNDDRRTLAIIGAIIHSNLTTINTTNEIKAPIVAPTNQMHDFLKAIGALNLNGNVYGPNGANLSINKTSGIIWGLGINSQDYLNPHQLTISEQTALTFRYRLRNITLPNGESVDTTSINPNQYDNSGVLTTVPNNKFTIQRINLFQSGLTRIQYGQTIYQNMDEAKALIQTEDFITEQNIGENAIFRAFLIIKQGVTNLTTAVNNNDAAFIPVDKFGAVVGGAGVVLSFDNITTGLGYVPENVANKVHDLNTPSPDTYLSTSGLTTILEEKLDKITSITLEQQLYSKNTDGSQSMINLSELSSDKGYYDKVARWWYTGLSTGGTSLSQDGAVGNYSLLYYGRKVNPYGRGRFNIYSQRLIYKSYAIAGSVAGMTTGRASVYPIYMLAPFDIQMHFDTSQLASSKSRLIVGLYSSTTDVGLVEPSTLTDCILFGNDSTDTNMNLFFHGNEGFTKIDLGSNFPVNEIDVQYRLVINWGGISTKTLKTRIQKFTLNNYSDTPDFEHIDERILTLTPSFNVLKWFVHRDNIDVDEAVEIAVSYVQLNKKY